MWQLLLHAQVRGKLLVLEPELKMILTVFESIESKKSKNVEFSVIYDKEKQEIVIE